MEKIVLAKRDFLAGAVLVLLFFTLALGFGYFFGSYDQLQKSKARLEVIPDVNCGAVKPALH